MKLDRVSACATSDCWDKRAASASAAANDGPGASMVLGEVCGFFIKSNRVETDSTLRLRRSRGLESKRSSTDSTSATTSAKAAIRNTVRRWRARYLSTLAKA